MKIPFIDLKAQQDRIRLQIEERIKKVLDRGQYIMGPKVKELEQRLDEFTGAKHAITCSSGTDVLLMVLMARGVGPGDAVFTTPFTFIATAEAITLLGATPFFVDNVFNKSGYKKGAFSIAEAVSEQIFTLPMHPHLTEKQTSLITNTLINMSS